MATVPLQDTDPIGHQIRWSYAADTLDLRNLVVTETHPADGTQRSWTLDSRG